MVTNVNPLVSAPSTIVYDIGTSTTRIAAYWAALRAEAIRKLGLELEHAPGRSYLWPFLIYGGDTSIAASLGSVLELECDLFRGFPMRDPNTFLRRIGEQGKKRFTYCDQGEVPVATNLKLSAAVSLIASVWDAAWQEMDAATLGTAWINSPSGKILSASDPKRFGVIHLKAEYFSVAPMHELATALIHETSHHALFVETARDRLLPNDFGTKLYSPFRKEMRPAIGVLHAAFVLARIGKWGQRLLQASSSPENLSEVTRIRRLYVSYLRPSLKQLSGLSFSEQGRAIVSDLHNLADDLEALPG